MRRSAFSDLPFFRRACARGRAWVVLWSSRSWVVRLVAPPAFPLKHALKGVLKVKVKPRGRGPTRGGHPWGHRAHLFASGVLVVRSHDFTRQLLVTHIQSHTPKPGLARTLATATRARPGRGTRPPPAGGGGVAAECSGDWGEWVLCWVNIGRVPIILGSRSRPAD